MAQGLGRTVEEVEAVVKIIGDQGEPPMRGLLPHNEIDMERQQDESKPLGVHNITPQRLA